METLSPSTLSLVQSSWHSLHSSLYLFTKSNLPTLLLSNLGDRGEMSHSIEGRTPFLDHHLTEYVNGLPPSVKIRPVKVDLTSESNGDASTSNGDDVPKYEFVEKWILREAAKPFITPEIYNKRKHPYSAPLSWPVGGPLYNLLKRLVEKERVERLGWIEWGDDLGGHLMHKAFKEGDTGAWKLLLMIAQWTILGEKFGVKTWKPEAME